MRKKIIFINKVDTKLSYRIYRLVLTEFGYYKIESDFKINNNNYEEYRKNTNNEYCYVINNENRILEKIYKDDVVVLKKVLGNMYEYDKNNVKRLLKSKDLQSK